MSNTTLDPREVNIQRADLKSADVRALITHHHDAALAANAVCEGHALDISDFESGQAELFSAYHGEMLIAIGGLATLSPTMGELKAIHTTQSARGSGVGQLLVSYLIDFAKSKKLQVIKLETGTTDFFSAAERLYRRLGFVECDAFAAYVANPDSLFMELRL